MGHSKYNQFVKCEIKMCKLELKNKWPKWMHFLNYFSHRKLISSFVIAFGSCPENKDWRSAGVAERSQEIWERTPARLLTCPKTPAWRPWWAQSPYLKTTPFGISSSPSPLSALQTGKKQKQRNILSILKIVLKMFCLSLCHFCLRTAEKQWSSFYNF